MVRFLYSVIEDIGLVKSKGDYMIRYFCDRCKREIDNCMPYEELTFRTKPDVIDGSQRILKKYMLCNKCSEIISNMIETDGTVDVSQLWKR